MTSQTPIILDQSGISPICDFDGVILEWKDPPPVGGIEYQPIVAALCDRPGDWALVFSALRTREQAKARAQSLRRAGVRAGRPIETAIRGAYPIGFDVYAHCHVANVVAEALHPSSEQNPDHNKGIEP
jgi:hypothetical protein